MKQVRCCKQLYSACKRIELRNIGWHTLRHTFASHLAQKNISLITTKELLGHDSIKTTMRYAHLSQSKLRSAIDSLEPNKNFGQGLGKEPNFSFNINELTKIDKAKILSKDKQKADIL